MNVITPSIREPAVVLPSNTMRQKVFTFAKVALMALGLILSTFFNAPWYIPLGFFTLGLVSLFPIKSKIESLSEVSRITRK